MKKAMKMNWFALAAFAGIVSSSGVQSASAQGAAPASSPRFSVDLKDATLRDALELVFQAAGNPSHIIDPAASQVRIGSVSFKDQEWRDIVRTLANLNKFRLRRENGSWIVDPRALQSSTGSAPFFNILMTRNASMSSFSVEARTNAQFGTTTGTTNGTNGGTLSKPAAVDSNNPWTIIEPLHMYAGALALLFQGGTVSKTAEFLVPLSLDSSSSSSNGTSNSTGGSGGGFGSTGGSGGTGGTGGFTSR